MRNPGCLASAVAADNAASLVIGWYKQGSAMGQQFATTVLIPFAHDDQNLTFYARPDEVFCTRLFNTVLGSTREWGDVFNILGCCGGAAHHVVELSAGECSMRECFAIMDEHIASCARAPLV